MNHNHDEELMSQVLAMSNLVSLRDAGLFERLAKYINDLVNNDFDFLVSLLYRIDVDEKKLRGLLASQPGANAGALIARLIIERQEQKIKTREQFKPPTNIPEEEKW